MIYLGFYVNIIVMNEKQPSPEAERQAQVREIADWAENEVLSNELAHIEDELTLRRPALYPRTLEERKKSEADYYSILSRGDNMQLSIYLSGVTRDDKKFKSPRDQIKARQAAEDWLTKVAGKYRERAEKELDVLKDRDDYLTVFEDKNIVNRNEVDLIPKEENFNVESVIRRNIISFEAAIDGPAHILKRFEEVLDRQIIGEDTADDRKFMEVVFELVWSNVELRVAQWNAVAEGLPGRMKEIRYGSRAASPKDRERAEALDETL